MVSFKPWVPSGRPCPHSCLPLTCVTGWAFTGNSVLLFEKQNITTHLKAGILRIEWRPLCGVFKALGGHASFMSNHPLTLVLEASYFLQFSEHLFTAPNLHFLPSLMFNISLPFGSLLRCHFLLEAFSGSPHLGYVWHLIQVPTDP